MSRSPEGGPAPAVDPTIAVAGDDLAPLAARLRLPLTAAPAAGEFDVIVLRDPVLRRLGIARPASGNVLTAGFERRPTANDPLARAIGLRRGTATVVDATAGLGRDAFVLAALGARVTMVERHPVLVALLDDALSAMPADDPTRARLSLVEGDAAAVLAALGEHERPDAVYLDPLFPPRGKRALPGLAAQLLRLLGSENAAEDDAALLDLARRVARRRAVVKRHPKAPALGGRPDSSVAGTRVRFDVYAAR